MSTAYLTPCELEDLDEEKHELCLLIEQYDDLYERCWTTRLTPQEQHELDQLYAFLLLKEGEFWDDAYWFMEMLTDLMDLTFPTLRYSLGLLLPEDIPVNEGVNK